VLAETVYLETIDGVTIEADIIRSQAAIIPATVVIGHPHPLYGGDRFNHVVQAIQRAAESLGCHSIAVDFRGVGESMATHDNGDSERLDLAAACELVDLLEPDNPIIMAGYSFGAVVGLNVSHPYICGWLSFAPPTTMMASTPLAAHNHHPKVLLLPEHDQFTSEQQLRDMTSTWNNTQIEMLQSVDHSIAVGAKMAATNALSALLATLR